MSCNKQSAPSPKHVSAHLSPPAHTASRRPQDAPDMNWTGGSLQRTKKANTGMLQQQKAYFARARTQLQNATDSPVAPFRPSFLQDSESLGFWGITPFGSGSMRHTGHAAKRSSERTQREPTPEKNQPIAKHHETSSHGELHRNDRPRIQKGRSDFRGGKHKASEMDADLQLLEANRRRLLTQPDWVGIDASKPVSLRFLSSREKNKIGKRRRMTRGRGAVPRQKSNDQVRDRNHRFANDAFAGVLRGGSPHQSVDKIRIRIGTDALTNTYSTQRDQYARSHASSEPMLFDQEEQQHSASPPVDLQLHAAFNASEQARDTSHALSTGERSQHYSVARRSVASPSPGASSRKSVNGGQLELQCQPATTTLHQHESFTHDFRLTHHAQGHEFVFRLAFSGCNSTAGSRGRTASDKHQIGETKASGDPDSPGASKVGYVHQLNSDTERSVGVEVLAGHAIVDEGPWTTYLAISDGSSHSDTAIPSRSSILHDYPTKGHNNEAAMDWSQHATQGQGNESRISSSSISPSLPCLKRGAREAISAQHSGMAIISRDRPVKTPLQSLDEDEKNWQAFVFESNDNEPLPGMHDYARKTPPLVSKYSENASSNYLPLSHAVSSVSAVVYESGSELASGTGYDALDSRARRPPSRARNARPLASGSFVEELSENKQGEEMMERRVVDGQSYASVQNHAFSDITRVYSDGQTSRSLEPHASAQYLTRSSGRRLCRNFKGSFSGCDILTSDDGALHLVDPDQR